MAIIISHSRFVHAAFVSSLVCQTFDRMILGKLSFPGTRCFQGGTSWKYRAHKWYAIRKSLGTADIQKCLNMQSRYAAMTPLNLSVCSPGMSKPLKLSGGLSGDENQQGRKFDKTCRFYTCICKERRKKSEKQLWGRWQQTEKARLIIENEKKDPFQFVCV